VSTRGNEKGLAIKPGAIFLGLGLGLVIGLGAWVRWRVIQAGIFQVDEFISMLAISMILEKGLPILPSGLFYDHGLLFSYLGALAAHLAGGDLLAARWWSLCASLLSIGLAYLIGWRFFKSPGWALLPAAGFALYSDAILWGSRVRMYSQANLLLLLWLLLFWLGTLGGGYRWARLALIVAFWAGLNTHPVLLLVFHPLVTALIIVWLIGRKGQITGTHLSRRILTPGLIFEALFALGLIGVTVWQYQTGFVASYTIEMDVPTTAEAAINPNPVGTVIDFGFSRLRWVELGRYLTGQELLPFTSLALLGTIILGLNLSHGRRRKADLAALFLVLTLAGTTLIKLLFVADSWHEGRYRFLVILPPLLLLFAYGVQILFQQLNRFGQRQWPGSPGVGRLASLLVIALLAGLWPILALAGETTRVLRAETDTPNQYNLAFAYVEAHRGPADQIITARPAASYIFSTGPSYYVNDLSPVLIPDSGQILNSTQRADPGYWVDGYTGTPYLNTIEALNGVFEKPGQLWFVIDEKRLYGYLDPIRTQSILWRMEVAQKIGNILILREKIGAEIPPESPAYPLDAAFANEARLTGYTVTQPRQQPQQVGLTTFWESSRPMWVYKVFVHLRNQQGDIVAQADFDPLEQIDPEIRDRMISQAGDETIPLQTTLSLPPDLPSGTYQLFLGLYNRETLERLPVVDDSSGENAIFLDNLDM